MQLTTPRPLRTVPLETADRCEVPRPANIKPGSYIYCNCGKAHAPGAVVNHKPVIDVLSGECSMVRQLYCDCCDHIITWCELARPDGAPLGVVVSGPGYVKQRKAIERFLRKHPWAAGISQDAGHY